MRSLDETKNLHANFQPTNFFVNVIFSLDIQSSFRKNPKMRKVWESIEKNLETMHRKVVYGKMIRERCV